MKLYKVTKIINDRYYSMVVNNMAAVEYKENIFAVTPEWLKKKGYGLTVFTDFECAKGFAQSESYPNKKTAIFEAVGIGEIKKLPPYLNTFELGKGYLHKVHYMHFPESTKMFHKVKLTKLLEVHSGPNYRS